jgi:hypothetical protein
LVSASALVSALGWEKAHWSAGERPLHPRRTRTGQAQAPKPPSVKVDA